MRTCFICGEPAKHADSETGEALCGICNARVNHRPPLNRLQDASEWAALHAKLIWLYDEELARLKLTGRDPAWNADVRAWRELGR